MKLAPVLRWPGSKWRIAPWIVGFFPPHDCYVELFFGSGAAFFTKEPSENEIINDLDGDVVNLFRVIRNQPDELAAALALTPWARDEYLDCRRAARAANVTDPVERARIFITLSQQGFGLKKAGAGNGWRVHDNQRNAASPRWAALPDKVFAAANRLISVQVENRDALKLAANVNSSGTLIYADPPYLFDNRTKNGEALYRHEMGSSSEHTALLETLLAHVGPAVISHYPSELYTDLLSGWHVVGTAARAQSNARRRECLYINPVAWAQLRERNEQQEKTRQRQPVALFGDAQ